MKDGSEAAEHDNRPLAIFDIDGVLADVRHRLHLVAKRPKDWDAFFNAADTDPLLPQGYQLAHEMTETHEVLYLTGRPRRNQTITSAWLHHHGLPRGRLFMRPDRDWRPARVFKRETLKTLAAQRDIAFVIDDDPEVVEVLRQDGLPVTLATWAPYTKALAVAQEQEGRT